MSLRPLKSILPNFFFFFRFLLLSLSVCGIRKCNVCTFKLPSSIAKIEKTKKSKFGRIDSWIQTILSLTFVCLRRGQNCTVFLFDVFHVVFDLVDVLPEENKKNQIKTLFRYKRLVDMGVRRGERGLLLPWPSNASQN